MIILWLLALGCILAGVLTFFIGMLEYRKPFGRVGLALIGAGVAGCAWLAFVR